MTIKLKPCPFCGSEAQIQNTGLTNYVMCGVCLAKTDWRPSKDKAVALWNCRVKILSFSEEDTE